MTFRPPSNWTPIADKTKVELSSRRPGSLEETVRPASPVAPKKDLSFSGLLAARQWLINLGAQHGLTLRAADAHELDAGFTDAVARTDGTAILIGENAASTAITVRVTGPSTSETKSLISTIRQQFASAAPPPMDHSVEAFREHYHLPPK